MSWVEEMAERSGISTVVLKVPMMAVMMVVPMADHSVGLMVEDSEN